MKVKTAELNGTALDWAVAKCEYDELAALNIQYPQYAAHFPKISPSTDWSQGGALIERECIKLAAYEASSEVPKNPAYWEAVICTRWATYRQTGPTALIAAMRCYVSATIGEEVEIPKELQS